jgi:hypothetical protein
MVARVSSLWTPGGEHRVPDAAEARGESPADDGDDVVVDEEAEAALRAELDDVRQRLAQVPAAQVVANHAMGLFELAAIHLSQEPANLPEATLAIDAMAALVDGLGERLGPNAKVLRDALAQIRLAYVQVKSSSGASGADRNVNGE